MDIKSFRIKRFRSIIDSGWHSLSIDGITAIIGQNEAGKSAVLSALHAAFCTGELSEADTRVREELPEVRLRLDLTKDEISSILDTKSLKANQKKALENLFHKHGSNIEIIYTWVLGEDNRYELYSDLDGLLSESALEVLFGELQEHDSVSSKAGEGNNITDEHTVPANPAKQGVVPEGQETFILSEKVNALLPISMLFDEVSGLLPDLIEIDQKKQDVKGNGDSAARSFLKIAGLSVADLQSQSVRHLTRSIDEANKKITKEFQDSWGQHIAKGRQISLVCELDRHSDSVVEKAGIPFLRFWIDEGNDKQYPRQRSKGVRWFMSFFLQLKAAQLSGDKLIFLLDEPGANLHERAQRDVLALFEKLRASLTIIYATHMPELLDKEKPFRILAVQREEDGENCPSQIYSAHELGCASSDTLSPLLRVMGASFSRQDVIQHTNNVMLEEPSAYYYLRAFWKLCNVKNPVHFLSCTGVDKVPDMAYLFLGWGLEFLVLVDDENNGRKVIKELTIGLFGGDATLASKRLLKLDSFVGIEDILAVDDFKKILLPNAKSSAKLSTELVKSEHVSKPITALLFWSKVESGEVTLETLSEVSRKNIESIVKKIRESLENYPR